MPLTQSSELKDQAATAALYVTKGAPQKKGSDKYPLDEQGHLSAAGAASSLKHANLQDLPSFPVVGLANTESSAGAAASLANRNQKSFDFWKPGEIPAASKAAIIAKDYKPAPLWQPELSAAGSKAALLAAKDGGDVKIWRPESTDAGHSAAGQAMRMKGLSPQIDYGFTTEGAKKAMMAANGALSGSRNRAMSTPVITPGGYPDSHNSSSNALKAANSANISGKPQYVPGRAYNPAVTNMSREMYTSHPPVAPELEEKKRQALLRAAAVSMAKQMYDIQQKHIDNASAPRRAENHHAATNAQNQAQSPETTEHDLQSSQFVNLQEAAQRLASERLAKLHDEHLAYRTYYGTQATPQSHKLSIRGRQRRRASSDGQGTSDEERSRQIRSEMSLFTDKLAQVDSSKRQRDRDSLLAAAQRNVRASMHGMDEKVFNETGKASPAMMEEWEAKARARAVADSESRLANHGKVNIGGGKYMDQSEVDAIAAAKVQPALDEISAAAEARRARDEDLRLQQQERELIAKERAADQKERDVKTREEWRRFKEEEKAEARMRKEEEKSRRLEERRLREQEKRKSKNEKAAPVLPTNAVIAPLEVDVENSNVHGATEEDRSSSKAALIPGPTTGMDQANTVSATTETSVDPGVVQVVTEEFSIVAGEALVKDIGDAETIARRVFAAPIESGPDANTLVDASKENESLTKATSNIKDAPVLARGSAPVGEAGHEAPAAIQEFTVRAEASPLSNPEAPIIARIAPTKPAATTETTVTGPSPSKTSRDRDAGKVSSWLKTRFSRRASKPARSEPNTIHADTKEPTFVGGANLAGPGASTGSSEHGDSSVREVAIAGKEKSSIAMPNTSTVNDSHPQSLAPANGELYEISHGQGAVSDAPRKSNSSPSISSLSSDEDTRGRSAIRLADQTSHNKNPASEAIIAESMRIGALDPSSTRQSAVSGSADDQFEEANDTLAIDRLDPATIPGPGREGDSPARDSKFVEEL